MFLQKIRNVSKLKIKFQATNCSSGNVEGSFDKFLKFFGQKSEKFLLKNRKNSGKKTKKNCFFRNFYSGHADRILRTMPKVSAENAKRFKILEKKIQATNCSSGHVEGSFENFLKFFGRKSEKFLTQNPKKFWKGKQKKLFLPQFLLWTLRYIYETHTKGFCRKSKTVQNFLKNFKATSCSCGHAEGSFHNFFEVFWPKVWKLFAQISKKFWKRKQKKNCFFRNFYSGHVDRNLRTMPKVSAENPKRFKTLEKKFKSQTFPLDT